MKERWMVVAPEPDSGEYAAQYGWRVQDSVSGYVGAGGSERDMRLTARAWTLLEQSC